ncbi:MAG: hypothetical protein GC147_07200 [Porphyrobacter sp.]|nr:hypothetical protein [Porphyrobacter sp.]
MRWARAGLDYGALVFALGFVLGTLRVLWLAPLVGLVVATAFELPVMLAASWWLAERLLRRFAIAAPGEALAMGLFAFALLLAAECALAVGLSGQSPAQWLAGLAEPHAALGLAGQVGFALIPWVRARRSG